MNTRNEAGLPASSLGLLVTRGLAHRQHQQSEQRSRQADDQESELPRLQFADHRQHDGRRGVGPVHDRPADDQRKTDAEDRADGVHRQRPGAFLRRKAVSDHRVRRGRQARLAHADADAREEERQEAVGKATGRGHHAPERHAHRDQVAARAAIREPRERDTHDRVEEGERQAAQQAELGVGDRQVALHRLDQQREDLAVDEGGGIGRDEQHHHGPGARRLGPRLGARTRINLGLVPVHATSPAFRARRRDSSRVLLRLANHSSLTTTSLPSACRDAIAAMAAPPCDSAKRAEMCGRMAPSR